MPTFYGLFGLNWSDNLNPSGSVTYLGGQLPGQSTASNEKRERIAGKN